MRKANHGLLVTLASSRISDQMINPIETAGTDIEPAWDAFGINRCDFRPQWDGDLVNLFSVVDKQESESTTEQFMKDCARAIAGWVGEHKAHFGAGDRFQIIIGWPKTIRATGRQTIKTGGTYIDLASIASGDAAIEMRRGWSVDVFTKKKPSEQADAGQPATLPGSGVANTDNSQPAEEWRPR